MSIEQLRKKLKQTDIAIITHLAKRQELCKQIGRLKLEEGKKIIDLAQERENMALYENLSQEHHMDPSFIKRLFKVIVSYSRRIQKM